MAINFIPPAADKSVQVISALFGDHWWGAIYGQAAGNTFIYHLVTSVNAIAFAAVGLVLSYVVVNSAVATTSEGIAMGKRYHSFWVPFRGALSVGMIAPLPAAKSLCLLQTIVLLFAYYGIGFADSLYSTGLTAIAQNGASLYSQFQTGKTSPGASGAVVGKLLGIAVDDVYLQYRAGYTGGIPSQITFSGPYQDEGTLNALWWAGAAIFGGSHFPFSPTRYRAVIKATPPGGGVPVVVGTVDIQCATPRGDEGSHDPNIGTCGVQEAAVNAVWPHLVQYAGGLVGELPNQPAGQSHPPPNDAINNATAIYDTSLQEGITNWVRTGQNGAFQFMKAYNDFINQAKNEGWAYAGVYYWQILRANSYVNNLLHNKPKVAKGQSDVIKALSDDPDYQLLSDKFAMLIGEGFHSNGFISPEAYLQLKNSTHRAANTAQYVGWRITDAFHQVKEWEIAAINTMTIGLLNVTVGSISGPSGGLIAVKNAGDIMIDIGVGVKSAQIVTGMLSAIPIAGKIAGPLKSLMNSIGPVGDMLILEGIGLAYIAPAIPFGFMALAFLAWVIFLLEAWVAAPLWAMAHALPDGEGFAGMRAQAGYMMFLNLLIKPPLIVIGFFFALILANTMIWFISGPFMEFVKILQSGTLTGLFALGSLIFIYTGLVVVIVYKCYGLITYVPDKVPAWLGQVFRELGPHADGKSVAGALQGGKTAGGLMSRVNTKTGEDFAEGLSGKGGKGSGGEKGGGGAGAKLGIDSGIPGGEGAGGAVAEGGAALQAAEAATLAADVGTGGAATLAVGIAKGAAQKEGGGALGDALEGTGSLVAGAATAGLSTAEEMGAMFAEMNDGYPTNREGAAPLPDAPIGQDDGGPPPEREGFGHEEPSPGNV